MPMVAARAGTKAPACAITAISAFWRRKVDLPAMFGPVSSHRRRSVPSSQSLGTKPAPFWRASAASTTGWRPPSTVNAASSVSVGRTWLLLAASSASAEATSSAASERPAAAIAGDTAVTFATSSSNTASSSANAWSAARPMRVSRSASSAVLKRVAFDMDCRRVKPSAARSSLSACTAVTSMW